MSSETDHPRQRTVAELLAEHGDAGATGRRRRRREADGDDGGAAAPVNGGGPTAPAHANGSTTGPSGWPSPPTAVPDRSVLREPVPREAVQEPPPRQYTRPSYAPQSYAAPDRSGPDRSGPDRSAPEQPPSRTYAPERVPDLPRSAPPVRDAPPVRENPTDHIPRYREDRTGILDPGLTGPISQQPRPLLNTAPAVEDGPGTEPDDDGGPATMVGVAPAGAEAWHRSRTADADGGPPTQAASPVDFDDHPAGLGDDDELPDDLEDAETPQRRSARSEGGPSSGQAWAAVVAQWIVGAVGGAALWVGFRFLWRELPVVALAAAVLVTVGLVLVVRALLRNNDMRTTVFAVLVGLLLTVSPAILVLLGR